MKPNPEIRLEIVRLLLQNASADNINHARIIKSADALSCFVILAIKRLASQKKL